MAPSAWRVFAQGGGIVSEGCRRLGHVSIAIYRRYRPQTFQEVIGQDHVVSPLQSALAAGRTTHAYLFSGPRGCGKTTSARILARCLNCVQYPTDTPCGECESCIELARDGSGSLDVVELDAASHGGVDDARELREQAGFAPVRDRFKIFIIDEAHMVSNQGFNALLKLVEEPPEHVKFIFATTEPEKVIGTIRSRTHHYPFRLVPPQDLENYLAQLCEAEGVSAGKDVLSLVVRAGTGSVRDTLSVLDQIIGGSDGKTLDYDRAVALLGYTSAHLLDDAVSAVASRDGAALFGVVDSVVKSGHDPRRFVEDLLQRLRDIVIISLAGEGAQDVFVSVPRDQYERMVAQAQALGAARASRCADLTNDALTAMVGATAPRLQLELLCARLIVAEAPSGAGGGSLAAKNGHSDAPREGAQVPAPAETLSKWKKPTAQEVAAAKGGVEVRAAEPVQTPADTQSEPVQTPADTQPEPVREPEPSTVPPKFAEEMPASARAQIRSSSASPADVELAKIVKAWPQIGGHSAIRPVIRAQLGSGAAPVGLANGTLTIGFENPGIVGAFAARGGGEQVSSAIKDVLGIDVKVEGVAGQGDSPKGEAAQVAATNDVPLPQEPDDGLDEPQMPELDPVYDYVEPPDHEDPAGVLGPLVDGTATFVGEDNTRSHLEPVVDDGEHGTGADGKPTAQVLAANNVPADDVPFYAQEMPAMPPVQRPEQVPPVRRPEQVLPVQRPERAQPAHDDSFPSVTDFPAPPPLNRDGSTGQSTTDYPTPAPASPQGSGQGQAFGRSGRETRPVWEVHPPVRPEPEQPENDEWDDVSADDPDISESTIVGIKVLMDRLDGTIIEEIPDVKEVR